MVQRRSDIRPERMVLAKGASALKGQTAMVPSKEGLTRIIGLEKRRESKLKERVLCPSDGGFSDI
jgi:hypothetical protein